MNVGSLSLNTNIISLGSLLGTNGSQELIDSINSHSGASTYFGSKMDPFASGFRTFMTEVITPIREVQTQLAATARKLFEQDQIRAIDSIEELEKGIPPSMVLPIVYYEPVRKMLEEERIDGFGIDPKLMQDFDIYLTSLESGVVDNITSDTLGPNGEYEITYTETTMDPELSIEEKYAISDTRRFIDKFMTDDKTKHLDFTNYPRLHS